MSEWYGGFDYFDLGATDKEIIEKLPGKFEKVLKEFSENAKEVGNIDLDTLTIIFKSAKQIGGPLESRATIAIKAKIVF